MGLSELDQEFTNERTKRWGEGEQRKLADSEHAGFYRVLIEDSLACN